MKDKLTSFLLAVVCLTLTSAATATTTWYVNGVSGSDSNNCTSATTACKTIGHAISLAASGNTIKVAAATYMENLTIGMGLKILGAGAKSTIIDGGGVGRVVNISSASAHVTLSRVTIRNGSYGIGGAGIFNVGTVRLLYSTVTGNAAKVICHKYFACHASGAGIYNSAGATVTITDSTLAYNVANVSTCSYAICTANGGAVYNAGTATISNSTLNGNVAWVTTGKASGGGIYNIATAIVSNSTLSGNTSGFGGGINNAGTMTVSSTTFASNGAYFGNGIYGNVSIQNSILANSGNRGNCSGTLTSLGYNLSSDATCNFTSTGDVNNTDPMLGPLQNNGGPTQTMALPSGSPAVDAGNPGGCTDGLGHLLKTDQRGKPRPDTEDTAGCDVGAYERQSD